MKLDACKFCWKESGRYQRTQVDPCISAHRVVCDYCGACGPVILCGPGTNCGDEKEAEAMSTYAWGRTEE